MILYRSPKKSWSNTFAEKYYEFCSLLRYVFTIIDIMIIFSNENNLYFAQSLVTN